MSKRSSADRFNSPRRSSSFQDWARKHKVVFVILGALASATISLCFFGLWGFLTINSGLPAWLEVLGYVAFPFTAIIGAIFLKSYLEK